MIDHRSQEGMPMRRAVLIAITAVLAITSQEHRLETVGPTEDGGFLLSTDWRMLAALNAGYAPASISLIDLETSRETTRVTITDGWRGLAFSPAGDKLY